MTHPTYPFTLDSNGGLQLTSTLAAKVAQAIRQVCLTEVEERVLRPSYGRDVKPFDAISIPGILGSLRLSITKALAGYQGVQFVLYGSIGDDGVLEVTAAYSVPDEPVSELVIRLPGSV